MSQAELFGIVEQVQEQYAALFAQIVTINFAMIIATFYFLRRTRLGFRVGAFAFYMIGMLTFVGMLLQQANVKRLALSAMATVPDGERAPLIAGMLAYQQSWLFRTVGVFENGSLWALVFVVAYMLFMWKGEGARGG